MDEEYRKKLEGLSRGAMGGELPYQKMLQRQGKMPQPVDTSISPRESDLIRQAQMRLVEQERSAGLPQSEAEFLQKMGRPVGLTEQEEMDMLKEFDEPQDQMPNRFDKLKQRYK